MLANQADKQQQQQNSLDSLIQINQPLANKNWFRTGGLAHFFCEPTNDVEFQQALYFAHAQNLCITLLGEGANCLIHDDGFAGLVIRPQIKHISRKDFSQTHDLVEVGCGLSFQALIDWCLEQNLIGLEEFSGIPGTVGGSVFINIHYFEHLLSQFFVSGRVIHKSTGVISTVDRNWFSFGYNYSTLHEHEFYLVDAVFMLAKADAQQVAYARGRRDEIIRHRHKRYPHSHTCGSFFRNFFEHEISLASAGKKIIFVAYYLDKIGVKGELSVGDAIVSYQHANMIVNRGNATTADIISLAQTMQKLVYNQFGVIPQPECRLIGFNTDPFLLKN